jgi:hypothetical protein
MAAAPTWCVCAGSLVPTNVQRGLFAASFTGGRRNSGVAWFPYVQLGSSAPTNENVAQFETMRHHARLKNLYHWLCRIADLPFHCNPSNIVPALRAEARKDLQSCGWPAEFVDEEDALATFTLDILYHGARECSVPLAYIEGIGILDFQRATYDANNNLAAPARWVSREANARDIIEKAAAAARGDALFVLDHLACMKAPADDQCSLPRGAGDSANMPAGSMSTGEYQRSLKGHHNPGGSKLYTLAAFEMQAAVKAVDATLARAAPIPVRTICTQARPCACVREPKREVEKDGVVYPPVCVQ